MSDKRPGWLAGWVADRDEAAAMGTVLGFSLALGTWTVALPLLAVASGWDAAGVGLLAILAGASHLAARVQMAWLLGRLTDRLLLFVACGLVALPYAVLLISQDGWVFVVSQVFNGAARAMFWTASQTHAVRGRRTTVRALAQLQVLGSAGQVAGPVVAGALLATAPTLALGLGLASAVAAAAACLGLAALPVYARPAAGGALRWWHNSGVRVAAWASFTGGGWRAVLGSYVPVALAAAGHNAGLIGLLVGLADGASIVAAGVVARLAERHLMIALRAAAFAIGAGLAVIALLPELLVAVAAALAVSGAGSGLVTTLGPAIAAESAGPDRQGEAIALTGTSRATALLAVPAAVAGLLVIVGLSPALFAVGLAMGMPALAASLRGDRPTTADAR